MDYKIGFIVEQALGHITHGQNLRRNVAKDPSIHAYWGFPEFKVTGLGAMIPGYRSNWTLRASLQARQLLAEMQRQAPLDVVFFHTQVTATLAQDWLARVPSVVSLDATPRQYDSLGGTYDHRPGPQWLEWWKWRLNRDCFRKARHIVAWSAWAKDGLAADYEVSLDKVTVIPPGVNVKEWTAPSKQRQTGETVRIIFVGGDFERKGGLILLQAFRSLRQRLSSSEAQPKVEIELHLVTRRAVPEELGVFVYNHLNPNSQELKMLYFNSHIFCLPTLGDCLPMVLSEAGAAGLPAVSTQVGAIEEIIRDGETGFLVPVGDGQALLEALQRLVCDSEMRIRLGAHAAELVRRDHDAETNAARLLDLLKQVADENGHQRK
jgi:glycosyltransferase involved in cell wall biosynthesis